eukprot:763315-Hanusia_phi.AAC.1
MQEVASPPPPSPPCSPSAPLCAIPARIAAPTSCSRSLAHELHARPPRRVRLILLLTRQQPPNMLPSGDKRKKILSEMGASKEGKGEDEKGEKGEE